MERLAEILDAVGKTVELLTGPDGTRILVLPHGGRILGLFAGGCGENFLWTNPALRAVDSARAFFLSDQWCNSGGDRTWLAPEVDFFLPRFPDTTEYFQPRQLDPGRYRCTRDGGGVRLENRLTLRSYRTEEDIDLRIVKHVEPAANPLRCERKQAAPEGLRFAGYTLRSTLELSNRETQARLIVTAGLWQLLQLPHGGRMLIPTYARSEPKVYFGAIPDGDLAVEDRLVRFVMRGPGEHKIGVRALAVTGRVGYVYRSGSERSLVVRNFGVNPSATYADVPWDDLDDLGYAVQACSVCNERLGSFSELEYHVPAIGGRLGPAHCEDVSQVWAFRGAADAVRRLAGLLLGSNVTGGVEP